MVEIDESKGKLMANVELMQVEWRLDEGTCSLLVG